MDSDWFILSHTCPSSAIVTHTCPFTHLSFTYLSFHTPVLSHTWLHALVQVSRTCPFTHLGFTSLTLLPVTELTCLLFLEVVNSLLFSSLQSVLYSNKMPILIKSYLFLLHQLNKISEIKKYNHHNVEREIEIRIE